MSAEIEPQPWAMELESGRIALFVPTLNRDDWECVPMTPSDADKVIEALIEIRDHSKVEVV